MASLNEQTVFSKGIFHGLPTFPDAAGKKYSAIVAGANGITGSYIVRALAEAPERWGTIYALSRRPPRDHIADNVKHLSVDFLSPPEDMARQLKEHVSKVDFAFFAAYIQVPPQEGKGLWSDEEEMTRVNVLLLSNFLSALTLAGRVPRRFLLQTGGKHYGLHLGPALTPMEETDPRFLDEPNFYFPQEDLLWKWAAENKTEWNVIRPGFIIGAVRDAAMNIALGLALYAAVQKELNQSLEYPGDISSWEAEKQQTSAQILGYHSEWAVLSPAGANQILNSSDNSPFTYGKFWPVLAALHGIPYRVPELDDAKYLTIEMPTSPPPRGFGPAGKFRLAWSFEEWAQKLEVRDAWTSLKKRHGVFLERDPFENTKDVFGLLDGEILGPWGRSISMNKNRKLGWHGFVDTHDSFLKVFEELADLKMIPPFKRPESLDVKYLGYEELATQ